VATPSSLVLVADPVTNREGEDAATAASRKLLEEVSKMSASNDVKAREVFRHLIVSLPEMKAQNATLLAQLEAANAVIAALQRERADAAEASTAMRAQLNGLAAEHAASKAETRRLAKEAAAATSAKDAAYAAARQAGIVLPGDTAVGALGLSGGAAAAAAAAAAALEGIVGGGGGGAAGGVMLPGASPAVAAALASLLAAPGVVAEQLRQELGRAPLEGSDKAAVDALMPPPAPAAVAAAAAAAAAGTATDAAPPPPRATTADLVAALAMMLPAVPAVAALGKMVVRQAAAAKALAEDNTAARAAAWLSQQDAAAAATAASEARRAADDAAAQAAAQAKELAELRALADTIPRMKEREANIDLLLSLLLTVQPRAAADLEAAGGRAAASVDLAAVADAASDASLASFLRSYAADADRLLERRDVAADTTGGGGSTGTSTTGTGTKAPTSAPAVMVVPTVAADERVARAVAAHPWLAEVTRPDAYLPSYRVGGTGAREPAFVPVGALQHRVFMFLVRAAGGGAHLPAAACMSFPPDRLDAGLVAAMNRTLPGVYDAMVSVAGEGEGVLSAAGWDAALAAAITRAEARGVLLAAFAAAVGLQTDDLELTLHTYLDPAGELQQASLPGAVERLYVWLAHKVTGAPLVEVERNVAAGVAGGGKASFTLAQLRKAYPYAWMVLSAFAPFDPTSPDVAGGGGEERAVWDLPAWAAFLATQTAVLSDAALLHLLISLKRVMRVRAAVLAAPPAASTAAADAAAAAVAATASADACVIM